MHSLILLFLSNEVLYEVFEELTVVGIWHKLEKLFMMKSICNKLLLKSLFWPLYERSMPLKEHFNEIKFVLMELHNIDVKMENKDLAMILLASLHPSYENFVSFLGVGNDSITLDEVKSSLYSRELRLKASGNGQEASTFVLLGTNYAKGLKKQKTKCGKKSKVGPNDIYNFYKEPSHLKRSCPKKEKKDFVVTLVQNESLSESDLVLAISEQLQQHFKQWILDSSSESCFITCVHTDIGLLHMRRNLVVTSSW